MNFVGNNSQANPSGSNIVGNAGVAGASSSNTTTATGTTNPTTVFGTGSSIFGSNPSSSSIFGKQPAAQTAGVTSSTAASTTPSIFGGTTAPATAGATPVPNFFGGSTTTPAATGASATPSLFGGSTAAPVTTGANNIGSSFFATPPASASPQAASLFGAPGSTNTNAPKTGLFAQLTPTATSTTTPGTTPSVFNSGSLFGPKPTDSSANATTTTKLSSNFFATPTGTTSATSGSLFGTVPKPAGESTSGTTTSASGGSSSAPGLFGKKSDAPAASAPASTTPAAAPTFSLGGSATTAGVSAPPTSISTGGLFGVPSPKTDSTIAATSTTGLFGSKDTASEKKDTTPAPIGGGLFGAKPATTPSGTSSTLGSSALAPKEGDKSKDASLTATIAVPPPSVLRGKTIEEIVNKWSSDLETHVREFNRFAGEVAVWDRALMENGNNLAAIYSHVLSVEREQSDIEQSLDHIEQQQRDLSSTLDAYERSADEILGGQNGSLRALDTGPADTERDKNYILATELHTHLDDLSASLSQMIDSVNALSLAPTANGLSSQHGNDDTLVQISQILSSHLESLQWIDGAVREVEGKVTDVERRVRDAGMNGALGSTTTKQKGFALSR